MKLVAQLFTTQALPFFDSSRTPEGLLAHLQRQIWASQHHLDFEKACCAATIGDLSGAREYALVAIQLYRDDGASWCNDYVERCQRLIASIEDSRVSQLLREWRDYSTDKLGLENLLKSVAGD